MRRLATLAVVLLAGCAHSSMVATSSGTTVTTTSASVSVGSSSSAGAWVLLGIILISAEAANPTRPLAERPPPLDAARRVNEQDCTQPIVDASANLKCR
jgi:hypothetical protein